MPAKVETVIKYMEELAPASFALPDDPVGLQLGDPQAGADKILVALDPDQRAVEEAERLGANMLVTHHPLFYTRLSAINENLPAGALIAKAIRSGLNIFCAHTNYDVAPDGVTYRLAKALGFQEESADVLEITGSEQFLKLVVFVPAGHEDKIRNALAEAGAGQIGNYSYCTFQTAGIGTFKPEEGTSPYVGSAGRLEKVEELRLETILPVTRRKAVVEKLIQAHPYEEVAYDLYPLALDGRAVGLGLILKLDQALALEDILQACRQKLNSSALRYWPAGKRSFKMIALCGGSGGSLIEQAARKEADLFISGDFRYHDLKLAQSLGLALIDAGHDGTEWPGVAYLREYLEGKLKADNYRTEVILQAKNPAEWSWSTG